MLVLVLDIELLGGAEYLRLYESGVYRRLISNV